MHIGGHVFAATYRLPRLVWLSIEWGMAGWQCYHCKQWINDDEQHDCWTTTEAALTQDLSEDLREAWERLRETIPAE